MRRRLAIGDHDDLALAPLVAHQVATQRERVLKVRAVGVVDAERGDVLDAQLLGRLAESHHGTEVPGELRTDQLGERQHHLLGGNQIRPHGHGKREVDGEDRRATTRRLELLHREVVGVQGDRRPGALAKDGVAQGLGDVQSERLARLPRLGGLFTVATTRHRGFAVAAQRRRIAELGEEVLQGLLTDLANALGAQGEPAALAVHESLILQGLEGLLQAHHVLGRVRAEVSPHRLDINLRQPLRRVALAQELLETAQLAQRPRPTGRRTRARCRACGARGSSRCRASPDADSTPGD